jgi:putative acyl-CoA dehydrogenase
MTNILADLAIESEAATLLAFRAAVAVDAMENSEQERRLARVVTPLAKFWNCKRASAFVAEALECQGGNGFIEENPTARLYREAPLNAIWEGTSNMMCMDVLRTFHREPRTKEAFMVEVSSARGTDRSLDRLLDRLGDELAKPRNDDGHGRKLVNLMAYAMQASELAKHSDPSVFDYFSRSRLHGNWGGVFGTLEPTPQLGAIVERATVQRS